MLVALPVCHQQGRSSLGGEAGALQMEPWADVDRPELGCNMQGGNGRESVVSLNQNGADVHQSPRILLNRFAWYI